MFSDLKTINSPAQFSQKRPKVGCNLWWQRLCYKTLLENIYALEMCLKTNRCIRHKKKFICYFVDKNVLFSYNRKVKIMLWEFLINWRQLLNITFFYIKVIANITEIIIYQITFKLFRNMHSFSLIITKK